MTYYSVSGNPVQKGRGTSTTIRGEFVLIQTGFGSVLTDMNTKGAITGQAWTGTHNFTGATVTAPTPTTGDSSTNVATTAFVAATAFSSSLPGQGGNAGKALTTDGATASWGTIGVAGGGTGFTSYTAGDIVYASGASALSKLAAASSGNVLLAGTSPSWGKVGLASHVSGTLPPANGGTGAANGTNNTITFTGNFTLGWTLTANTALALPITGTLATLAGIESFSNKTTVNPTITNYTETLYAPAAGSAFTIDLTNGTIQKFTTNADMTLTLPASVAGKGYTILVVYGGVHNLTFAGGSTIKWPGGVSPTATSVNAKTDIFSFTCDGTNTYGGVVGKAY